MSKFSPKAFAIIVTISLLTASAYPAFAEERSSSTGTDAVKQNALINAAGVKPNKQLGIGGRPEKVEDVIATMKEKLASKTAALKTKLAAFKDQKKASIAERVNTKLNALNQNQTTQMQKHLDTMTSILDKLETRVNNSSPDIKNPVAAKSAITSARYVIATASAAVSAQAQKDYTIQATSETRIKTEAQTQRDKLHTDFLTLRKTVIDAKQAVVNVVRIANSGPVKRSGLEKEGTTSGQQ